MKEETELCTQACAECKCLEAPSEAGAYIGVLTEAVLKTDLGKLNAIADKLAAIKLTGTIFLAGNGGSAATASHFANDLSKGVRIRQRTGFRVQCLNDPNAIVTCLANDFCYEDVYDIMLRTYAKPGDILLVFSGSGNSENILRAVKTANEMGLTTIGFGGRDGGKMKNYCHTTLIAPTDSMEQLEDMHMIYVHALVCRLKALLKESWDLEVFRYPSGIEKIVADRAFISALTGISIPLSENIEDANSCCAVITADVNRLKQAKMASAYTVGVIPAEEVEIWKNFGMDCNIPAMEHIDQLIAFLQRK